MSYESAAKSYDYRRIHERKSYTTEIVFNHDSRLYAGSLKDISLGGAYIETLSTRQFSPDDTVTISIPFTSGKNSVKCKGRIKWINPTGFALEFV
jgi:hypothetical protein